MSKNNASLLTIMLDCRMIITVSLKPASCLPHSFSFYSSFAPPIFSFSIDLQNNLRSTSRNIRLFSSENSLLRKSKEMDYDILSGWTKVPVCFVT